MKLINARIKNFRLLEDVSISFETDTTVIVGRNNTGKTSLTEIFNRFLNTTKPRFKLEDFSLNTIPKFQEAYNFWKLKKEDSEILKILPSIELETVYDYKDEGTDYGSLSDFIIDFDETIYSVNILFEYRLIEGRINSLFTSIDESEKKDFINKLRDNLSKYYDTYVFAIDPSDSSNRSLRDIGKAKDLITVEFIHAQRGLDDETSNEKDMLGKVLTNIFKSGNTENAPDDLQRKSKELEDIVDEIQVKIDGEFRQKVNALLPALKIFGYPGLSDPALTTETILDIEDFLASKTKVLYKKDNGICLPETYNGLGSRNLIYILFQLYDYFRKYQAYNVSTKMQVIFIEEPEVHLHPQMQEVFINKIEEIVKSFSESLNRNEKWNVQFVVSTHSSHIANAAKFHSIRYFLAKNTTCPRTIIRDLNKEFNTKENNVDREFIHKYLTLTKCDLFFADKAIMFEGPTERILMPEFIKKIDKKHSISLSSQFISSIEIGGAYAHHFYKFFDFLEIKTLIITDIDSINQNPVSKRFCSCIVSAGTHTSNVGLKKWFVPEKNDLASILTCRDDEKCNGFKRIAFQIPEVDGKNTGRSFEESFILANLEIFGLEKCDASKLELTVSEKANEIGDAGKANFAIEYALEKRDWKVPAYIDEGLKWLSE